MALIGTVAVQSFHQCARLSCDLPVNTIRELRLLIGAQSLQSVLNGAGSTRTVEIENTVQRLERLAYEERTPQKATTKDSKDGIQVGSTLCTFIYSCSGSHLVLALHLLSLVPGTLFVAYI